jgi:hypothetical protein
MREYEVPSANIRITFARYGILRESFDSLCAVQVRFARPSSSSAPCGASYQY